MAGLLPIPAQDALDNRTQSQSQFMTAPVASAPVSRTEHNALEAKVVDITEGAKTIMETMNANHADLMKEIEELTESMRKHLNDKFDLLNGEMEALKEDLSHTCNDLEALRSPGQ